MRHRRAERCRLRAEAAIEAGLLGEAREALDEARRLQPDLPGLIAAEERLVEAERIPVRAPVPEERGARTRVLLAVASIALAAGIAGWVMSGERAHPPATAATSASTAASRPAIDGYKAASTTGSSVQPPAPASQTSSRDDQTGVAAGGQAAQQPVQTEPDLAAPPQPALPVVTAVPLIEVPPPMPAPPSEPATLATPSADAPASPPPTATPALPPPSTPKPSPVSDERASSADGPVRADAAEPGAETWIRAALSHYEAAYSALDAAAARAVWPTVDADALGRAFGSLQSQQVSLGSCAVSLGITRRSARANCAGTATWTPRIGGGARTEHRRWTFDLELAGDRWQIVRATAR